MRRRFSLVLACLLSACSVTAAPPPAAAQAPRYAIMDDYVRERLAADWIAAQRTETVQVERAYCLRWQLDIWAGEPAYRVTQIERATEHEATSGTVSFTCPAGEHTAQLHVHPPHTCVALNGPCWKSGPYAWQCLESDQDRRYLAYIGEPFGLIQCDEHAVITFWPPRR